MGGWVGVWVSRRACACVGVCVGGWACACVGVCVDAPWDKVLMHSKMKRKHFQVF
jgi:hypothetical protein